MSMVLQVKVVFCPKELCAEKKQDLKCGVPLPDRRAHQMGNVVFSTAVVSK
jgi:hypothetical protein